MATLLGIDYGTKRIGLAVGDEETRLPTPIKTIVESQLPLQIQAVARLADEYDATGFVLGLPLNMDDTEGPQAKTVRTFGDRLAAHTHKPVYYVDERLSSFAADDLLRGAELTRKKKKGVQDAVAATVILQSFFQNSDRQGDDDQQ